MTKFTKAQTAKIKTFNDKFGNADFVATEFDGETYAEYYSRILNTTWYIGRDGKLYDARFNVVSLRGMK